MDRLQALTARGLTSPSVRQVALDVTRDISDDPDTGFPDRRDRTEIARAIYNYIVGSIAYVHDPHGVEQIQSARATLYYRTGDCDDMSVLSAALLGSLGVPVRFVVIGTNPQKPEAFTHIYVEYLIHGGQWIAFDPVIEDGVGIAVPASAVVIRREYDIFEDSGPAVLATLAGVSGAGAQLGSASLGAITTGPINGPDAWLQITGRSHSGTVPANETFYIDVYVERIYELFGTCDVRLTARQADTGELLAESTVFLTKWRSLTKCKGEGRLTFPLGFQPSQTPVILEVIDIDILFDQSLGISNALYLTEQEVTPREPWWEGAGENANKLLNYVQWFVMLGLPIAGLFVLRPYVEPFIDAYGEDEDDG